MYSALKIDLVSHPTKTDGLGKYIPGKVLNKKIKLRQFLGRICLLCSVLLI